jgi:hypothetical protein
MGFKRYTSHWGPNAEEYVNGTIDKEAGFVDGIMEEWKKLDFPFGMHMALSSYSITLFSKSPCSSEKDSCSRFAKRQGRCIYHIANGGWIVFEIRLLAFACIQNMCIKVRNHCPYLLFHMVDNAVDHVCSAQLPPCPPRLWCPSNTPTTSRLRCIMTQLNNRGPRI